MAASVTVTYVGDDGTEGQIRERLDRELEAYEIGWRVSVSASAWSDIRKITVVGPRGQEQSVTEKVAQPSADQLVEEAAHMARALRDQRLTSQD
jgi:hypothetical protein